mmetsp:Transcript_103128/g.189302  ORF Transcript_103128/g.189302 Transcript_103128/m.189302 type:complete len:94 (+) Transcript_103128:1489-1770(+)
MRLASLLWHIQMKTLRRRLLPPKKSLRNSEFCRFFVMVGGKGHLTLKGVCCELNFKRILVLLVGKRVLRFCVCLVFLRSLFDCEVTELNVLDM